MPRIPYLPAWYIILVFMATVAVVLPCTGCQVTTSMPGPEAPGRVACLNAPFLLSWYGVGWAVYVPDFDGDFSVWCPRPDIDWGMARCDVELPGAERTDGTLRCEWWPGIDASSKRRP